MIDRNILLLLIAFNIIFHAKTDAQTTSSSIKTKEESFYSITRNNAWIVNQYYITSKKTDKKSAFKNCTFRFNQEDSSTFLIESTGTDNMTGYWNSYDDNKVIFSLPLITRDSSFLETLSSGRPDSARFEYKVTSRKNSPGNSVYNEVAMLLSGGPMQIVEIKPAKLKFKMLDALRGEVFVEFFKKE